MTKALLDKFCSGRNIVFDPHTIVADLFAFTVRSMPNGMLFQSNGEVKHQIFWECCGYSLCRWHNSCSLGQRCSPYKSSRNLEPCYCLKKRLRAACNPAIESIKKKRGQLLSSTESTLVLLLLSKIAHQARGTYLTYYV